MDGTELTENENFNNNMSIEQSVPSGDSLGCDFFDEQEIFPRIGGEYQVEIPEVVEKSDYLSNVKNPANSKNSALDFLMGLPILLMSIDQENGCLNKATEKIAENSKVLSNERGVSESEIFQKIHIRSENDKSEVEILPPKVIADNGVMSGESVGATLEKKLHDYRGVAHCLVPGLASQSWNDAEKSIFLLGLYIFEKNIVQLRTFIESKKMGDILSFYYGKFYRSNEYCRWSECRKMRSRRCAYGEKIFTGPRQQELLSRILPSVSEECKNALMEVSKTYTDGKMSLEEYVSSLKYMVGMNMLVEAVGIGKGKQDLTGMTLEPSKSIHVNPMRSEIPIGKAWASLTSGEIVKFLTGGYRLSKARSNDLFWEAVWPRLLARGWQSEKAKDQVYTGGTKNIVFLVPGVKKFSRRKQVKGNHYFDSYTDILSKVASEPWLIELDIEGNESKRNKEEDEGNHDSKLEEDDMPTRRRHCYLRPRTPNRNTDGMKFTVVDTSLDSGTPYKVRELRSLPFDNSNKFHSGTCLEDCDEDTSEVSLDESDSVDTVFPNKGENDTAKPSDSLPNGEVVFDGKDLRISATKLEMHSYCPDSESVPVKDSMNSKRSSEDEQSEKVEKHHLSQSVKEDNLDNIGPVIKRRRRLTACSRAETSNVVTNSSVVPVLEPEMPICSSARHESPSQVVSSQDKNQLTSSSKGSPIESVQCARVGNCNVAADPQEYLQNEMLIDLNLPQFPVDFENDVSMTDGAGDNEVKYDDAPQLLQDVASSEQQSNMNPQRRSSRNRPPTTRALEALANGYLTVNRRRKSKEGSSQENLTSRPSRRSRVGPEVNEFSSNPVASIVPGGESGANSGRTENILGEFKVLQQQYGAPISGP